MAENKVGHVPSARRAIISRCHRATRHELNVIRIPFDYPLTSQAYGNQ
jgi:hypothetical protein